MALPSITSVDTFRQRAQHSEHWRTIIMLCVLAALVVVVVIRRLAGDEVMVVNRDFESVLAVLLATCAFEVFVLLRLRQADRRQQLLAESFWRVNALIELAAPLLVLAIFQFFTVEGRMASLSAPVLLVLPLILVLSILRLKPGFTLVLSIIAASGHLALTLWAIAAERPSIHHVPMLLTYPALLMLCGVCCALVAREVRRHVREAINETMASEAARQRIAGMEHDLSIARDIQRGLIPSVAPNLPDFDIAGFSRPADLTGGDYYDWQLLPDGRVLAAMADVTGHGIGPALVMAICRAYARAVGPLLLDLQQLLGRLNSLICDDVRGQRFITLALAVIDAKSSTIDLISAGHGPTLLWRAADATVHPFNGDGVPLGILADEAYGQARRLNMQPGDMLLMLTDGYFECRRTSDNQQFGIERIERLLINHARTDDAATFLKRLDNATSEFVAGGPQTDDMTAVVIRRR